MPVSSPTPQVHDLLSPVVDGEGGTAGSAPFQNRLEGASHRLEVGVAFSLDVQLSVHRTTPSGLTSCEPLLVARAPTLLVSPCRRGGQPLRRTRFGGEVAEEDGGIDTCRGRDTGRRFPVGFRDGWRVARRSSPRWGALCGRCGIPSWAWTWFVSGWSMPFGPRRVASSRRDSSARHVRITRIRTRYRTGQRSSRIVGGSPVRTGR
ncbi:MAG: hypothetical protein KatS3mg008_1330 [Acidimicrobiales bacterium]|nr:MAG: hypothetical protein KatS3mg008_1330 [Acidimicrobiales bacterium]